MTDVRKLNASELVKLAAAVGDTGTVLGAIFADGTVGLGDIAKLPSLAAALQELGDVQWSQVVPQAIDVDASEVETVAAAFKQHLNLADDNVERLVEQGVDVIVTVARAVQVITDVIRKPKAA